MPQSLRKLEQHLSPGALPLSWSLSCHLLLVGGTFLWPVACSCLWLAACPMACPCPVSCPCPSCQCSCPSCPCSWLGCSSPALVLSPPQVALAVGVELSETHIPILFSKSHLLVGSFKGRALTRTELLDPSGVDRGEEGEEEEEERGDEEELFDCNHHQPSNTSSAPGNKTVLISKHSTSFLLS